MGSNCCKGDAAGRPVVRSSSSIYSRGRAGASLDERFVASEDAGGVRLTVSAARTGDSGVYTLQASNAAGKDTTRVRLEVSPDEAPVGDDPPNFLRRLQDLTVKVGTRTRFLVEIVSSTECKVTWYRNERRLMETERVALVRDGNFWCADVAAVSVDDAGRWTCTAENVGGRASCSAHLNVLVPKAYKRPEFVEELRALLTEQGTVSLECKVVGVPTPVLRWFKDSREIKAGDVFALTANAEDPTSLGTYTCEAVNCMGRAYSSSKVHVVGRGSREGSARPSSGGLTPEPPPIFTKELEDQYVRICESLALSCHIVVPPWPRSVVWYNKEGKIEPSERYHVMEDGVGGYLLEVCSAEWADEGEWKCVATTTGGRVGMSTCYVSMDVPKNYRKPRFMENLQAVLTEEGLVSFECKVVGFPTPVLSWFKDGQELKPGDVYQLTGTNSLGSYCCIARNCMGQASSSAELTVEDIQNQLNEEEKHQLFSKNQAPKFIQGLKSIEAKIDEPFRFTIKVAIPPEPSLLWYRDDQPVDESSRCHHGKEERGMFYLDIQNLEFLDQAEWKCVAMNDFGQSVTSCFLKLIIPRHYKKPRFLENLQAILSDEGAVNLECKVIGVPQPTLKWYKDGEELKPGDIHRIISGQDGTCCLGTYTCEAQNCMGIAASSASLLGFDDSMKTKSKKKSEEQTLQRNLSLSTIHEERTSQMYDTPLGDRTLDDKGEISFSFDGKEVSVSLYETPDLTEEEALQIVEMYADQLSENVTEHNVVELPPLRFVKETSTSGNLLMEAIIIDVSPEYFTSPEEDLRTEADIEDISIADENGPPQISLDLDQDISGQDYLEKTMALLSDEKADIPKKLRRKKSDSSKSVDDYFSLSRDHSLSDDKKEDDTQMLSESDVQSFASAKSSEKAKSKGSKPVFEETAVQPPQSPEFTETLLTKADILKTTDAEPDVSKPKRERRRSRSSRRSSSGSEKSLGKLKGDITESPVEQPPKKLIADEEYKTKINNAAIYLSKVINDIQIIEKDIILQSELMASAATASKSLEIIGSLVTPLSEMHSIFEAAREGFISHPEINSALFNNLPQPFKMLHQSLIIIEKCINVESNNKTLVKKTCVSLVEKCGHKLQNIINEIKSLISKKYLDVQERFTTDIETLSEEIITTIRFSLDTIKAKSLLHEASEFKTSEPTLEMQHSKDTQRAIFELKSPLSSLLRILESTERDNLIDGSNIKNSEIILNDMSASIQDLQEALEQIESLSVKESTSSLITYNTEIIESVMDSAIQLRTSFEQLSVEAKKEENEEILNQILSTVKQNLNEIALRIDSFENKVGKFDIMQSENKLEVLQKMAQTLIQFENSLPTLDVVPGVKSHMVAFHKNLTKVLENVIESNDASKYLAFMEICDSIKRINSSVKNLESYDVFSLTSISNTLKIVQDQFICNIFGSELNCSLLNNIEDIQINLHENINIAEEISFKTDSDRIRDLHPIKQDESKAYVVIESIEHSIAAITNVIIEECPSEIKTSLMPVLETIRPNLEDLKQKIASMIAVDVDKEDHVSEISDVSVTQSLANPLFELNQNTVILHQTIVENVKSLKDNSIFAKTYAQPLHELQTTLEILQHEVISQYGEDILPYEISSNIANVVQNLQNCIIFIQENSVVETADEMSTLEDISGIKTTAELMPPNNLLLPTTEEVFTEHLVQTLKQTRTDSVTAKTLQSLHEHVTMMQTPEVVEFLDSLSEISEYTSLKSVAISLGELNEGVQEVFQPMIIENANDIQDSLYISKLTEIAQPIQDLRQSLSVVDTSNIPNYESVLKISSEKIHSAIENIFEFKTQLEKCLNVIVPAIETADEMIEISSNINELKEMCVDFIDSFQDSEKTPILMNTEICSLRKKIDNFLDATNVQNSVDITEVKTLIVELYSSLLKEQDELFQCTPQPNDTVKQEIKLLETVQELENKIAVLEEIHFVDLSRTSEIDSCMSPQFAVQTQSESLIQISELISYTVGILQELGEQTQTADLMILEDFFKTCTQEFSLLRCLITKRPTQKKLIRLIQEFIFLRSIVIDFEQKRFELSISPDDNEMLSNFLISLDASINDIEKSLINVVNSQSNLLIKTPIKTLDNDLKIIAGSTTSSEIFADLINKFRNLVEDVRPNFDNVQTVLIEELQSSSTLNQLSAEKSIKSVDSFLDFVGEQSGNLCEEGLQQVFENILLCLHKHQDYKEVVGQSKNLLLLKFLTECSTIIRDFISKEKDPLKQKEHLLTEAEETSLKSILNEIVEPLQGLHDQLGQIREQILSGVGEESLSVNITTTESYVQLLSDIQKDVLHILETENPVIDEADLSLIEDIDSAVHAIQADVQSVVNAGAPNVVKQIASPLNDIEKSLQIAKQKAGVELKNKVSKDEAQTLMQHIDQYIEFVEIVEEVSAIIKVDDFLETANIARELRDSIDGSVKKDSEEVALILGTDQVSLMRKLQKAVSALQVQALDNVFEMAPSFDNVKKQHMIEVVASLKANLRAIIGIQVVVEAPPKDAVEILKPTKPPNKTPLTMEIENSAIIEEQEVVESQDKIESCSQFVDEDSPQKSIQTITDTESIPQKSQQIDSVSEKNAKLDVDDVREVSTLSEELATTAETQEIFGDGKNAEEISSVLEIKEDIIATSEKPSLETPSIGTLVHHIDDYTRDDVVEIITKLATIADFKEIEESVNIAKELHKSIVALEVSPLESVELLQNENWAVKKDIVLHLQESLDILNVLTLHNTEELKSVIGEKSLECITEVVQNLKADIVSIVSLPLIVQEGKQSDEGIETEFQIPDSLQYVATDDRATIELVEKSTWDDEKVTKQEAVIMETSEATVQDFNDIYEKQQRVDKIAELVEKSTCDDEEVTKQKVVIMETSEVAVQETRNMYEEQQIVDTIAETPRQFAIPKDTEEATDDEIYDADNVDSMERLQSLLSEVNSLVNLSSMEVTVEDTETLRNILDEVQTVIIKLKRDFDESVNDTLNEALEDLECSVRSVQLQIDENSAPELLKDACATLQLLLTNMSDIKDHVVIPGKDKNAKETLQKCFNSTEQTITLLDDACKMDTEDQMINVISKLTLLKDTLKTLSLNFRDNADILINNGIEVIQSLDQMEEQIFSLEKDIEGVVCKADIKDNIIVAVHTVYENISNMRSTLSSIQKEFMYENYARPSDNFLKSLKNIAFIFECDKRKNWKNLGKVLRQVLKHFEDIKFYVNLDKTARIPSDAAFTKIILDELTKELNEVLLTNVVELYPEIANKVHVMILKVKENNTSIESRTTLEVKEKIPMFKDISNEILFITNAIRQIAQTQKKTEDDTEVSEKSTVENVDYDIHEQKSEMVDNQSLSASTHGSEYDTKILDQKGEPDDKSLMICEREVSSEPTKIVQVQDEELLDSDKKQTNDLQKTEKKSELEAAQKDEENIKEVNLSSQNIPSCSTKQENEVDPIQSQAIEAEELQDSHEGTGILKKVIHGEEKQRSQEEKEAANAIIEDKQNLEPIQERGAVEGASRDGEKDYLEEGELRKQKQKETKDLPPKHEDERKSDEKCQKDSGKDSTEDETNKTEKETPDGGLKKEEEVRKQMEKEQTEVRLLEKKDTQLEKTTLTGEDKQGIETEEKTCLEEEAKIQTQKEPTEEIEVRREKFYPAQEEQPRKDTVSEIEEKIKKDDTTREEKEREEKKHTEEEEGLQKEIGTAEVTENNEKLFVIIEEQDQKVEHHEDAANQQKEKTKLKEEEKYQKQKDKKDEDSLNKEKEVLDMRLREKQEYPIEKDTKESEGQQTEKEGAEVRVEIESTIEENVNREKIRQAEEVIQQKGHEKSDTKQKEKDKKQADKGKPEAEKKYLEEDAKEQREKEEAELKMKEEDAHAEKEKKDTEKKRLKEEAKRPKGKEAEEMKVKEEKVRLDAEKEKQDAVEKQIVEEKSKQKEKEAAESKLSEEEKLPVEKEKQDVERKRQEKEAAEAKLKKEEEKASVEKEKQDTEKKRLVEDGIQQKEKEETEAKLKEKQEKACEGKENMQDAEKKLLEEKAKQKRKKEATKEQFKEEEEEAKQKEEKEVSEAKLEEEEGKARVEKDKQDAKKKRLEEETKQKKEKEEEETKLQGEEKLRPELEKQDATKERLEEEAKQKKEKEVAEAKLKEEEKKNAKKKQIGQEAKQQKEKESAEAIMKEEEKVRVEKEKQDAEKKSLEEETKQKKEKEGAEAKLKEEEEKAFVEKEKQDAEQKRLKEEAKQKQEKEGAEAKLKEEEEKARVEKEKQDAEKKRLEEAAKQKNEKEAEEAKLKEEEEKAFVEKEKQDAENKLLEAEAKQKEEKETAELKLKEDEEKARVEKEKQNAEKERLKMEEKQKTENQAAEAKLKEEVAEAKLKEEEERARVEKEKQEAEKKRLEEEAKQKKEKDVAELKLKEDEEKARVEKEKQNAEKERLEMEEKQKTEKEAAEAKLKEEAAEAKLKEEEEKARVEKEKQDAEKKRLEEEAKQKKEKEAEEAKLKEEEEKAFVEKEKQDAEKKLLEAEAKQKEEKETAELKLKEDEEKARVEKEKKNTEKERLKMEEKQKTENQAAEAKLKEEEKSRVEKEKQDAEKKHLEEEAKQKKEKEAEEAKLKEEEEKAFVEKEKQDAEKKLLEEEAKQKKEKETAELKLKEDEEKARVEKEKKNAEKERLKMEEKQKTENQAAEAKLKEEEKSRVEKEKQDAEKKHLEEEAKQKKEKEAEEAKLKEEEEKAFVEKEKQDAEKKLLEEEAKQKKEKETAELKLKEDEEKARVEKEKKNAEKERLEMEMKQKKEKEAAEAKLKEEEEKARVEKEKQDAEKKRLEEEAKQKKEKEAEEAKLKEEEEKAFVEKEKQDAEKKLLEEEAKQKKEKETVELKLKEDEEKARVEKEKQNAEKERLKMQEKQKTENQAAEAKLKEEAAEAKLKEEAAEAKLKEEEERARVEKEKQEAEKKRLEEEAKQKKEKDAAKLKLKEDEEKARVEKEKQNAEKERLEMEEKQKTEKEAAEAKLKEEAAEEKLKEEEEKARVEKEKQETEKKRHKEEAKQKKEKEAAEAKLKEEEEKARVEKEKQEAEKKRLEEEARQKKEKDAAELKLKEDEEKARVEKEKQNAEKEGLEMEEKQKTEKEAAEANLKEEAAEAKLKEEEEKSHVEKEQQDAEKKRLEEKAKQKKEKDAAGTELKEEQLSAEKEKQDADKKRLEENAKQKKEKEAAETMLKEQGEKNAEKKQIEKEVKQQKEKEAAEAMLKEEEEEKVRVEKEKQDAEKKRLEEAAKQKKEKEAAEVKLKEEEKARIEKEKQDAEMKSLEEEAKQKKEKEAAEAKLKEVEKLCTEKEMQDAEKERLEMVEKQKKEKEAAEAKLEEEEKKARVEKEKHNAQKKRFEEEAKQKEEKDAAEAKLKEEEQLRAQKEKQDTEKKHLEMEEKQKKDKGAEAQFKEEERARVEKEKQTKDKEAKFKEEEKASVTKQKQDAEKKRLEGEAKQNKQKEAAELKLKDDEEKLRVLKEKQDAENKRLKEEAKQRKEKYAEEAKLEEIEEKVQLYKEKQESVKEKKNLYEEEKSENEKTAIGSKVKKKEKKQQKQKVKEDVGQKCLDNEVVTMEKAEKVDEEKQHVDSEKEIIYFGPESNNKGSKEIWKKEKHDEDVVKKYDDSDITQSNSIISQKKCSKLNGSVEKYKVDKIDFSSSSDQNYDYKEKPHYVNYNNNNIGLEMYKPPGYIEKKYGEDSWHLSQDTDVTRKMATTYKAQTLLYQSQLRATTPQHYEMDRNSESMEKRSDGRQRSKALSEVRSFSENRMGTSRDHKRKPVFSTYLTDRTAVEASRVKLTCSVLSSIDPTITWFKNGVILNDKLKYRTKFVDGLITLEVLNAVPSDSAEYTCTVENENGSVSTSANLKVYPSFEASPIPPTFTRSIKDTYHLAENELILECRIRGQPLPTITWLKDNRPISTDDRYQAYYLADGVCRLVISAPTTADSGKYTCKAENSMWSDLITHVVNFTGKESSLGPNLATKERSRFYRQVLESRRPHFTNVLTDYKVTRGGTIGLQVEIQGSPTRVEWLREGRSVTEIYRNAQTFIDQGLYTLALTDVTEKESGLYTCRAWSTQGNVDMNAAITVVQPNELEGRPAIIVGRPQKDVLISVGEDLNISFRVQGEPKPKVIFMKGIRDITNSQRVCKMTSDDYVKFTVKRSVVSDAGTYCILARNAYGCDRAFVTVVIRQRASSENLISDWTYPQDDTSVSISERKYKSVPERIPGEPSVVDGGNNWVSLAWPKPDNQESAPVLAYKVESWLLGKEGGARWVELGITPLNSFDAFNLRQGEEYHFRVTPRNRYGWGEPVQTSTAIGIGLAGDRPEFTEILPGQLKVLVGETANLSCSFKGKPTPEIVWMKNGHEIEDDNDRIKTLLNGFDCCLMIRDVQIEDEARYSCEASNVHGRASTYARMAVITDRLVWEADAKLKRERSEGVDGEGEFPPQFTMRLRDRRVQATYPVRLTCQVIGSPAPRLTWFKDGHELVYDSRHSKSQDEHFHTLEIAPTSLEDGGVYEAMARNSSGAVSCRCSLVVDKGIRAYVAPEFCCGLEPLYRLQEGEELRISAMVEAYPSVGVTWYRDGVRLRPSRRAIMTLDHDGQIELALASVTGRDSGVYTCTASNEVGRASTSGKVEVIGGDQVVEMTRTPPVVISPDVPYSKEPMFLRKPRSSEAREGDTVIIECEVIGDPKPDVYWLRDFLKPDYYRDANHFKRVGGGPEYRFEIPHAKLDYTGTYSVVARNGHGEAKAIISLQILAKDITASDDAHNIRYGRVDVIPRFDKELTDLLCYDGDAIEFECRVSGNPEPYIKWLHYNEVVRDCPDFETSYEEGTARLKIKQVTAEDEGTYTCEASNSLGKAKSSACLVVYPPGEPNTLSQRLRRPPALLSAASTPRSTPRSTPARSLSRTPVPDARRLCSPSREVSPKFYTYPFNKVAEEGERVVFKCAVTGLPHPWAAWDKDGILITPTSRITIREKDDILRILEIEEVTVDDVGVYRITLENDYGRAEASARLEVITHKGKFYGGVRSYSPSPRRTLYRRRTPSTSRQD